MSERAVAGEEKRRQLLDAAVRVFARKGFHASRVGDIAEEAGVAHGLLYHYFKSKDSCFRGGNIGTIICVSMKGGLKANIWMRKFWG